jgi:hypothetical protein
MGLPKILLFFAGYRIGYWFGDPRLQDGCREHAWVAENSANSLSLALFGMNLVFRAAAMLGNPLGKDDMRFLLNGMFGWGQRIDPLAALDRIHQMGVAKRFYENLDVAISMQCDAVRKVIAFTLASRTLSIVGNSEIGNASAAPPRIDDFLNSEKWISFPVDRW